MKVCLQFILRLPILYNGFRAYVFMQESTVLLSVRHLAATCMAKKENTKLLYNVSKKVNTLPTNHSLTYILACRRVIFRYIQLYGTLLEVLNRYKGG